VRRKSLKSKNANTTPLRSPINTRKRKSLATDASSGSKSRRRSIWTRVAARRTR
jgi:hypothetical protein